MSPGPTGQPNMPDLSRIALALDGVEQGIACAGTKLESRTFLVAKKSFLFVSPTQARLKLDTSAPEARELGFVVGANGWVTLSLERLPPAPVLRRWIAESHALASPKVPPARTKARGRKR